MAENNNQDDLFIVGIGASAGGVEALQQFFQNIPSSSGFSYVIIQHLSPDYKSLLVEILSRQTDMKVLQVEENMEVEPNVIYVIPNDRHVVLEGTKLQLRERDGFHPHMPIDLFFESLAKEHGDQSLAIILSGTGTDGTKGIAQIKKSGGLVFVQEPSTAKFDGMPNSAINAGNADFILSPESMWEELFTLSKQKPLNGIVTDVLSAPDEGFLFEILSLIKSKTSFDFTHYKRPTIARRLTRRMAIVNHKTLSSYCEFLKYNPDEIETLSKEFLIGVTQFFRDTEAFEILRTKIFPEIIQKKPYGESIKIWSAGCSTGEEAYSLAILLNEVLVQLNKEVEVKIFATDLDREAIDFASKGVYSNEIEKHLSPTRLKNNFYREGDNYRVRPEIRKMIIFSHHDVIKDPPFSKTDLVSCRNMLIYLNPLLQRRCLSIFHFSLNVGGYLFLGPSENMGELCESFIDVNKKWKIFQNLEKAKGFKIEGVSTAALKAHHPQIARLKHSYENSFVESFNKNLLEEFESTGIYVDANFNIIETFGNYKKYLHFPDEKFNVSILRMLPEELAILLGTNLRKAARDNERIKLKNLRATINGEQVCLHITIRPSYDNPVHQKAILLIFTEVEDEKSVLLETPPIDHHNLSIQHFIALEQELRETKEILQRAIEESETSNEELQSSNEELISSNEELQSTNEELQSLNEELHTVNSEHQGRIKEISDLNDDLNNYFRSTDIGKVFLDKNLIIRKFTPSVTKFFNFIENDIGRSITHFSNNLNYTNLLDDINSVMSNSRVLKKEIHKGENNWYEMKILPYIRKENEVDGVIITFSDITDLKNLNTQLEEKVKERTKELAEFNERFNLVSKATNDAIWDWNLTTDQVWWNEGFKTILGYDISNYQPSDSWKVKIHPEDRVRVVKSIHEAIDLGMANWSDSYRFLKSDGSYAFILDRGYCIRNQNGKVYRMVGSMQDITELEKTREAIREREEFLTRMIESSEDCIKVLDLNGNILSMNEGGRTLVEINDFSKWEGKSWFDFWQGEEKEDAIQTFRQALEKGKGRFYGYCPTAITKTPKWWDVLVTPILNKEGKPEKLLAVSRDVTMRKQLVDELKEKNQALEIINQIGKTISSQLELEKLVQEVTDAATKITGAEFGAFFYNVLNDKGEAYTLYTISGVPREAFSKFPMPRNTAVFAPTFHGTGILRSDDITKDARYGKNAPYHGMPKGHLPVVSYLAVPVVSRTGEVIGGLFFGHSKPGIFTQKIEDSVMAIASQAAIAMDNSKLYESAQKSKENLAIINEELKRKNEELQKINVDLDNFIYTASHDLKAPVSNIEGLIYTLSDVIKEDVISKDEISPILEMVNSSILRFSNTIRDLTTITKVQKDIEEEKTEVNIPEVIEDVKLSISDLIKASKADLIVDCDKCPDINFSRKNLQSVVLNLVTNAIKYRSPERTPEVRISARKENEFIVLSVKDNGLGLDKNKQVKLFSMFKRFHDHVEGTGIGLYLVKRIVTNSGGHIEVESEPGVGTEFKVYFKVN